MKNFFNFCLLLIFCCGPFFSNAQSISFPIEFDTVYTEKFNYKKAGENSTLIRMPYGSWKIINSSPSNPLKRKTVLEVRLICTDYPKGEDFTLLNKKRLASLFLLAPELFDNPFIEWTLVYQTGATKSDYYHYYHGFEIVCRPDYTSAKYEREYLLNIIKGYTPVKDSLILKIMKRNDWKDMTVVGDFTGSMSPYIGELLLWYNLTINKSKEEVDAFVFFNDGNTKADAEKKIGKTGGIYYTEENELDSVLQTAVTTIENGFGGDIPENDIEALLFAQDKFKESENFILVADNLANMRDVALIEKLEKPVRIIICGVSRVINTEYLNLALKTKGSIHTIEEDIDDMLLEIKEGEIINLGGNEYMLKDGRFILYKIKRT